VLVGVLWRYEHETGIELVGRHVGGGHSRIRTRLLGVLRILTSDPRHAAIENTQLLATNAQLWDQMKRLEAMVEKLGAKVESRDEALCLYSEVTKLRGAPHFQQWTNF